MVEQWVRDLVEQVGIGSTMEVGRVVTHPDVRRVLVTGGQFWGTHGLSNFWYWRPVSEDGSLGDEECGYGW